MRAVTWWPGGIELILHFLDGCSPCCPASWVNVGNNGRSSVFSDCFSPYSCGVSHVLSSQATGKFKILWSQWVSSLLASHMSIPPQSALPHHLSLSLPGPLTGGGLYLSFFHIVIGQLNIQSFYIEISVEE